MEGGAFNQNGLQKKEAEIFFMAKSWLFAYS